MTAVISNRTLHHQSFQRRRVVFMQRGLNELALLLAQPSCGQDTATKFELTDRQVKIMETILLHTFYGNRNHLGIRLWRVKANEFDTGLIQLLKIAGL